MSSIKSNDLDKMKKSNLLSLGKLKGLSVKQSMKKANIITLIRNDQSVVKKSPALENMKKSNLLLLGKTKGIPVKPAMKKVNIIKLIINGMIKKSPKPPSVNNMTKDELYKYAQSKSIFFPKTYSKQQMISMIKAYNMNSKQFESAVPDFDKMTMKELYNFAKDRVVSVKPFMTRNQIIDEILKSPEIVKKSTPPPEKHTRYEGWQITQYMAFMYLALKRRSVYHFLLDKNVHTNFIYGPSYVENYGIYLEENKLSPKTYLKKYLMDKFKLLRKNWLIIPVTIIFKGGGGHANIILYNKSKKHMEYFEPHGFKSMFYVQRTKIFAEKCKELLKSLGLPIETMEVVGGATCQIGLQNYDAQEYFKKKTGDPGGFCQAWVSWFVDYRLKYPVQNASNLVTKAIIGINKDPKGFKSFIRSYAEFVVDFMNVHAPNCKVESFFSYFCKQDLELMYKKVMYYLAPKTGKL